MKTSIGLLVTVFFICISCNHEPEHKKEIATYTVSKPEVKDTLLYKEYIGQIRAIQHIELRALEEGYLQEIFVDEGQTVKMGKTLFKVMPNVLQSEKQKALAEVNHAEIEYQNTKILADNNIVSKNELALSKALLDKAKAELSLAESRLGFTNIKAPFEGIVGRFNEVRLGSLLEKGELLTTLSDNSKMWVYFNVPEAVYLDFMSTRATNNKQEVLLKLANDVYFDQKGIIETIEADFNNETGNIAFRASFNNPNHVLRHGQTGKIYMPFTLKNAVLIPQKATFEVLDKKFVYVIVDGVVTAKQITVGDEMLHLYAVTSGLTKDDTILVDGLRKVKKGDKIKSNYVSLNAIVKELNTIKAE